MTESNQIRHQDDNEAVQAAVDRVQSWHAGAPVETVREHLAHALEEAGERKDDDWLQATAERISTADPAQR